MGVPEENKGGMVCPFCNWESTTTDEYAIMLHLETNHAEGETPFVVADKPAEAKGGHISEKEEDPHYIECPAKDCGEVLLAADLGYHLELHAAEQGGSASSETETGSPIITPSAPSPSPKGQSPPARRPTTSTRTPPSHSSSSSPRPSTTSSSSKAHRGETEGHRRGERKDDHHSDRNRDSNKSKSIWRAFFGIHHPRHSSDAPSMSPKPPKKRHKEKVSERLAERASGGTAKVMRGTRLGKAQLGKYAHEEQMPDWLVKHLEKGLYVKAEGIIPVLAQLFEQCSSTRHAFLCHPSTNHVSKLKREGGFCGYRNIQMLSSYIIGTKYPGYQHFCGGIPTIFNIQEMIETAWDHGINAQGRVETGGIRGTRKYIGTPEAMAMLRLLQIPFDVQAFKNPEPGHSEKDLLDMVERYLQTGISVPEDTDLTTQQIKKVWQTDLPPIYFQHAGHSMTIIGLEYDKSGARNLLVFDPMFHDASNVTKHVGRDVHVHHHLHPLAANMVLNPYRRGSKYLGRFREFEVIRLRPRPEINA